MFSRTTTRSNRAEPVRQPRIGPRRPDVGEEVQPLAEEHGRIDLALRLVAEVEGRGGPEDQAIGSPRRLQQLRPDRRPVAPQALMPDHVLDQLEVEPEASAPPPAAPRASRR